MCTCVYVYSGVNTKASGGKHQLWVTDMRSQVAVGTLNIQSYLWWQNGYTTCISTVDLYSCTT